MVGLTADQIGDSRLGTAVDSRVDALIGFARELVDSRGLVTNIDVQVSRSAKSRGRAARPGESLPLELRPLMGSIEEN
jgi:hypothetical protein